MRTSINPVRRTGWRRVPPVILAVASISLAGGCSDATGPSPSEEPALPRQLSVAEGEVITASNDFTFRLLRTVLADPELGSGNVFLSPFSVSMALGMTMNGADGETYDVMRSTLGFDGLDERAINESYRDLTALLLELDSEVELRIANSVWARLGHPFHETFYERARDYYGAAVRVIDFDAPDAPDMINAWVRDATEERIDEMVEVIDPGDIMFLLNAVYFKGLWTHPFDPQDTRPDDFYLEGEDDPVEVETMHPGRYADEFAYAPPLRSPLRSASDGIELVELRYGDEAFTMAIVMPPPDGTVDELVESLDAKRWESWTGDLGLGVTVSLPKWEMEYEARLNPTLIEMGMGAPFCEAEGSANFSRLTPTSGCISRVDHKTYLKVDEEGTEAAAATSVVVSISGPDHVDVDRPFLVAIRERHSGTILFIGVIRDPRPEA